MAKVTVKNKVKVVNNLRDAINSVKDQRKVLNSVGDLVISNTQQRTRQGNSLKGQKFKPLSASYKKYREGKAHFRKIKGRVVPINGADPAFPKTDNTFFRPSKSNLTLTGQLLRSLTKVVDQSRVSIFFKGRRDDGELNSDVAIWVQENGRPFFGFTKQLRIQIRSRVLSALRKELARLGFKK